MPDTTLAEALGELAALEDPKMRAANEKRGDDHGINLSRMRAVAKKIKTDQPLAQELWGTGETAARLLALLICRPRDFTADIAQPDETNFGEIETRMRASGAAEYVAIPLHDMIPRQSGLTWTPVRPSSRISISRP